MSLATAWLKYHGPGRLLALWLQVLTHELNPAYWACLNYCQRIYFGSCFNWQISTVHILEVANKRATER